MIIKNQIDLNWTDRSIILKSLNVMVISVN